MDWDLCGMYILRKDSRYFDRGVDLQGLAERPAEATPQENGRCLNCAGA
jgi:hypothetical protein